MTKQSVNYAFIDSQNLNLAIGELGWKLDFARFRVYLRDKFSIEKAFLFIGYLPGNSDLYTKLQQSGFICIFRPTLTYKNNKTKGNCDAELILHAMIEFAQYQQAVIVTGDGDFYCLAKYLADHSKLKALLVPNRNKYSALLKLKELRSYTYYMNDLQQKLAYSRQQKKKSPHKDGTLQGKSPIGDTPIVAKTAQQINRRNRSAQKLEEKL